MHPRLKVKLVVDTEADFYYLIPSPHFTTFDRIKWRLNKLRGTLYRYPQPSRQGILHLIAASKATQTPLSLCLVGHLYLKGCTGHPHSTEQAPEHSWYTRTRKNWYAWDNGGNYQTHPGRYFGDIIEKEKQNKLLTWGLHAFTHEALTLESPKVIHSIIQAGMHAAKQAGITPTEFAAPFELTEDTHDTQKVYNALRTAGITRVYYAGQDTGLTIKRSFTITQPQKEKGLEKIRISRYFEGTSSQRELRAICADILANKDTNATYCLVTHDFTHKNQKNALFLFNFLKKYHFL